VRAQWHLGQLTRDDNAEALRLGMQSAEQDHGDTAGLNIAAFAHIYNAIFGWSASAGQSFVAANDVARRAVSLDIRDEVAQTALGSIELFLGQIDSGIERLRGVVALNPSFTWAHGNLGVGQTFVGHLDAAIGSFTEALRLSPIDRFTFSVDLCPRLRPLPGRAQRGRARARRARAERPPEFPRPLPDPCGVPERHGGGIEEARKSIEQFLRLAPNATLKNLRMQVPLRLDENFERYAGALRRAGLPE